MSTSQTINRVITFILLLAGLMLLRKPIFGQAIPAAPTRFSVVEGVASGKGTEVIVIPGLSRIDTVYTSAYSTMPNLKIHHIDDSGRFITYNHPAAFDKAVQAFTKV